MDEKNSKLANDKNAMRMAYVILFLAFLGFLLLAWYFIFKENSLGKNIYDKGYQLVSDTGNKIANALSTTSPVV